MNDRSTEDQSTSDHGNEIPSTNSRRSISTQLLLTVNGICLILLLLFVVHDYRQETKRQLNDKRIALQEEALIIQIAVRDIQHHGNAGLQSFLDRTCARMEETHSPGHHIIVRFGDQLLQAHSHHQESDEILQSIEAAAADPKRLGRFEDRDLVVGDSRDDNLSVYVSEFVDDVHAQVVQDSLRRLGGSLLLGIIAAIIVNLVLLRIVTRPLNRLIGIVEQVGSGNFGQQVNGFRSRELSYLSRAINRMSRSLEVSDQQQRTKMEKARRIQQNLLPENPILTGATFAVRYVPADDVAGDFYDVRSLTDGSWVVIMADVTGHGIPAAMSATLLKAHFAEACERSSCILEITRHINRRFTELTLSEDFATAVLIRFEPDSQTLQIVNAGHDAVLYRSLNGAIRECGSSGLLLGVDETADWSVETLETSSGDRLLIYTDGVTETFDADRTMFGHDRVVAAFEKTATERLEAAIDSIVQTVDTFRGDGPQLDDVTAILIDF